MIIREERSPQIFTFWGGAHAQIGMLHVGNPLRIGQPPGCYNEGIFFIHCITGRLKVMRRGKETSVCGGCAGRFTLLEYHEVHAVNVPTLAAVIRSGWPYTAASEIPDAPRPLEEWPRYSFSPAWFRTTPGKCLTYDYHQLSKGEMIEVGVENFETYVIVVSGEVYSATGRDVIASTGFCPGGRILGSGERDWLQVISKQASVIVLWQPNAMLRDHIRMMESMW